MSYDVVVVGGGLGGLTVAALLAARGVSVCLVERQSQVGGCIGRVEFSGYDFEPGMGLHTGFGADEIYQQIFVELPVACPETKLIETEYVVRVAGKGDIRLRINDVDFLNEIAGFFPDCAETAVGFYQQVKRISDAWRERLSSPAPTGLLEKAFRRFRSPSQAESILSATKTGVVREALQGSSSLFQQFIDAQVSAFLQTGIDQCALIPAALLLSQLRSERYSIIGGTATVAERLAESIKKSGGTIRLNSPVLRLAYNESGDAIGVDLLSGERILANHAIVSNLTIWDTYGKLVGLNRTPGEIKNHLARTQAKGAYVIYAAIDNEAAQRLPANYLLVAAEVASEEENLSKEFTISIGEQLRDGKHAVTIKAATEVTPWFSFQTSEEDYEAWDQTTLEQLWTRLHQALPELGAGIEVIETANPRTSYDQTRRKLGMVLGVAATPESWQSEAQFRTSIPNLFIVSDTMSPIFGAAGVIEAALTVANLLH